MFVVLGCGLFVDRFRGERSEGERCQAGFCCRFASLGKHLTFSLYIGSCVPQYFHQSWSFGTMAQWFN